MTHDEDRLASAIAAFRAETEQQVSAEENEKTLERILVSLRDKPASRPWWRQYRGWTLAVLSLGGLALANGDIREQVRQLFQRTHQEVKTPALVPLTETVPLPTVELPPETPPLPAMPQPSLRKKASVAPAEEKAPPAAEVKLDVEDVFALALKTQFREKNAVEAAALWEQLLKSHPRHALSLEARWNLGLAWVEQCELQKAATAWAPFLAGEYGVSRQHTAEDMIRRTTCPPKQ